MLRRLRISNYELIDEIDQEFHAGLNVITGETGTGKSMILSSINLITGGRGSDKVLKHTNEKCVLEAIFTCPEGLKTLLNEEGLDFSSELILRREFTPQGRSRAFINDTPVNLDVLKRISKNIIDVHSQDQTNNINLTEYQLELLDIYSENQAELSAYSAVFRSYDELKSEFHNLKQKAQKDKAEYEFIRYQFEELENANLQEGEIKLLEEEKELLSKQEDIKNALEAGSFSISEQENNLLDQLYSLQQRFNPLNSVSTWLKDIDKRIKEIYNELKDLSYEMESKKDDLAMNPNRLIEIEDRLTIYYTLENKFKVSGDGELISVRDAFDVQLQSIQNIDEDILKLEEKLKEQHEKLLKKGDLLSKKRVKNAKSFSKAIEKRLVQLGISHPSIHFNIEKANQPTENGLDSIQLLFSSNKDQEARFVDEVASGGEKSRLMLAIKSIIGNKKEINSMVFDEIDTGISGEVAIKTGELLSEIGTNNQVLSITHLPQVASKGAHHFKVSKDIISERTNVKMDLLSKQDRIEELAEMLGGKNISESARKTAEQLLL